MIKNRQVFPWDPLQSTPGDRLHTQVFPGTAHHRGQTTQRGLPLAPLSGYEGVCGVWSVGSVCGVECVVWSVCGVECVWSVECVVCVCVYVE